MLKYFLSVLVLFFTAGVNIPSAQANPKPRIIVLTDIENEPDDAMSLVRLLMYSDQFDIEGLIATTSVWLPDRTAEPKIREIVEAYKMVRPNLAQHSPEFPEADFLLSVTASSIPKYGMAGVGQGMDSDGSELIISSLKKDDPRPLWVLVWGGPNCLAQSLWKLRQNLKQDELDVLLKKLRVYSISDQDPSGPWIRNSFQDLFYICSPGYSHNGMEGYHHATWAGISGDRFTGRFSGADWDYVSPEWIRENIQQGHGPLGKMYPDVKYLMEGDSPSFLYLIPNGLGNPEIPSSGSWGGRYEYYTPATRPFYFEPEMRPFWTNAEDEVISAADGNYHSGIHTTIWRWRKAYQNDFAARMDWCVKTFREANHPPLRNGSEVTWLKAVPGQEVSISADNSWTDPDGNKLSFHWFYYPEAGTADYRVELKNSGSQKVSFKAPDAFYPEFMHLVLEVTDDGTPALTRYQRFVVEISPEVMKPRTIILTDGDTNDKNSFVRYLLYSCEFETEGIISVNSQDHKSGNGTLWIPKILEQYEKVRPTLLKHNPLYPPASELSSKIFEGNLSPLHVHFFGARETEGARQILRVLTDNDPRPVWIQVWGGSNTLAQALTILKEDYRKEDMERALAKLRIYAVGIQDNTYAYISRTFTTVPFIQSGQCVVMDGKHDDLSAETREFCSEDWFRLNIREGHGPLGAICPGKSLDEKETPAFLFLVGNGLRSAENPGFGGWGGRYGMTPKISLWTDASDGNDNLLPISRWIPDIQNDYAARMDWSIKSFEEANHHPVIKDLPLELSASAGEKISLDARKSYDPDGDKLRYRWYFYKEAGSMEVIPELPSPDKPKLNFVMPEDGTDGVLHLILEISDEGSPSLKTYHRVIIKTGQK